MCSKCINRLITTFLRKYSDASSSEVGVLMMALTFVSVFTKPFFCALADRHRKYRLFIVLAFIILLIGFSSYSVMPFFPQFVKNHGRLAWYILAGFTIVGHIAFGVVWSLGDAYAANVSHKTGESYGMIRLWGPIGLGVGGAIVGALSPYFRLPEMALGIFIFLVAQVFEIALFWWWPNEADFEMGDTQAVPEHGFSSTNMISNNLATVTEKPPKELIETTKNNNLDDNNNNNSELPDGLTVAMSELKCGQLSIVRTQSNSLAITTKVKLDVTHKPGDKLDKTINELVRRATDLEAAKGTHKKANESTEEFQRRRIADLQMTIFKMVALKHKSLIKYLIVFVALGVVYNIHWSYFFLHLDQLAQEGKSGDFSTLVGMCLVAQAVGETYCFAIAPWVVKKLGRDGTISLVTLAFVARYFGNGIGIPLLSPYVAIITECLQGINYGIFYYLITDTALYYALQVKDILPDLKRLELIDDSFDENAVCTSLRATMQGIFSGAFDGLGFGTGSLVAGFVLEQHGYEELWCYTATASLVILVLHALYELINRSLRKRAAQGHFRASNSLHVLNEGPKPKYCDELDISRYH